MAQPDDMTLLMQRLRTLQLRLNAVDPGAIKEATQRVLEWRAAAGEVRGAETRRRRIHGYVTESVAAVRDDFEERFEGEFLPRLTQSFDSLLTELQSRTEALAGLRLIEAEDLHNGRVKALERSSASADALLIELRKSSVELYQKLAEVTLRLDRIFADDEVESVSGWRDAMESVRAEQEANQKTPMEAFREDAFGEDDEDDDEPASTRLTCPVCEEKSGKRQPRTGFFEDLAGLVNIAPYRCSRCMVRFYRYRPARKRRRV